MLGDNAVDLVNESWSQVFLKDELLMSELVFKCI